MTIILLIAVAVAFGGVFAAAATVDREATP
jgi:hypothetical protein